MDVEAGLVRLNAHLPLAERQHALPPGLLSFHRAILRWFLENGTPPTPDDLSIDTQAFERDITRLAHWDLVVTSAGALTGAYPFTARPTQVASEAARR